jgi:hypothetical protein
LTGKFGWNPHIFASIFDGRGRVALAELAGVLLEKGMWFRDVFLANSIIHGRVVYGENCFFSRHDDEIEPAPSSP